MGITISKTFEVNSTLHTNDEIACEISIPGTSYKKIIKRSIFSSEKGIPEDSTIDQIIDSTTDEQTEMNNEDITDSGDEIDMEIYEVSGNLNEEPSFVPGGCSWPEVVLCNFFICFF